MFCKQAKKKVRRAVCHYCRDTHILSPQHTEYKQDKDRETDLLDNFTISIKKKKRNYVHFLSVGSSLQRQTCSSILFQFQQTLGHSGSAKIAQVFALKVEEITNSYAKLCYFLSGVKAESLATQCSLSWRSWSLQMCQEILCITERVIKEYVALARVKHCPFNSVQRKALVSEGAFELVAPIISHIISHMYPLVT